MVYLLVPALVLGASALAVLGDPQVTGVPLVLLLLAAIAISAFTALLHWATTRAEAGWTEARASERRAQFLAEAGRILGSSLDADATLRSIALLVVPTLADWCAVDVCTEDGCLSRAFVSYPDAGARGSPCALSPNGTSDVEAHMARVARTGHIEYFSLRACGRQLLPSTMTDESDPVTLEVVCLPLTGRTVAVGVLTLAAARGFLHSPPELVLWEEFGRRAALAIDRARLHHAAQAAREAREHAAERLTGLNAIAATLAEGLTLNQVANLLLVQAVASTHASGGRVHMRDGQGTGLEQIAALGAQGTISTVLTLESLDSHLTAAGSIHYLKPDNVRAGASSLVGEDQVVCGVTPLTLNGRAIGALELLFTHGQRLDDEDASLLDALARLGTQALERARLYDAQLAARVELESANEALRAVQAVTDAALVHLDLNGLLHELLNRVRELLKVEFAAVLMLSEDGQALVECAATGPIHSGSTGARIPLGEGVAGRIGQSREPVVIDDLSTATVVSPVLRNANVQSLLGVPLLAEERLVGVIHIDSVSPRHFTREDVQLLQVVADRLALAINQARLYEAERSARNQAERLAAERAAVLTQIADGVVIANGQGQITFINDAAREFFGASEARDIGNAEGSASMLPDRAAARCLERAVRTGQANLDIEVHGAENRIGLGRAVPVQADDGIRIGAVLTVRDVTTERTLERRKDEFFSSVSHDLRTPVATIKGAAEVVLENEPPGVPRPLHRMLQIINDEADRMSTLVDDLLELTRLRAGRVQLQCAFTDMRLLVRRVAQSMEPLTVARSQRIVIDLPESPVFASVDANRIERALQNLIGNAQKYGYDGGVIHVRLHQASGLLHVMVTDDGPGIPEADLGRIFERFYRSTDVATRRIQGSGLGLPITRAMVELHGGRVHVHSSIGEGTTFTIVLPLEAKENQNENPDCG